MGLRGGHVRTVRPRRPNLAFWDPFERRFGVVAGPLGEAFLRGHLIVLHVFGGKAYTRKSVAQNGGRAAQS